MREGKSPKVIFKPYNPDQMMLLPPSLEELIPEKHLVRVVNETIDKLDLDRFINEYPGGGASSYHPMMMLKVLIYAYTQKVYTSRMIAKALRENVQCMWISGGQKPDFRTINRFRSSRLKGSIDEVFTAVVELLTASGHIRLENYFLDGTKIEANANKYSFVWGRATKKFKARMQKQVKELLRRIDEANEEEEKRYGDRDLDEMGEDAQVTPEMIEEALGKIRKRLDEDPKDRELKKAEKKIRKDYLPRAKKYEEQEKKLGGRNSYSKTDPDATFMRMKEDHMRNGQLKPGYNVQVGTENRFIVGFSVHQKPTDTTTMIPHLEKLAGTLEMLPENVIADAGYGSEENYEYLDEMEIGKYVKYNWFDREQKKSFRKDKFSISNLGYDKKADHYTCPAGRKLVFSQERNYRSDAGYESRERVYECENCEGCRHRKRCHKSKFNRRVRVRPGLEAYREEVRKLLTSEKGVKLRARRGTEVETAFAQIKHNMGFRRFLLRGLEKVNVEFGLISIAFNLNKLFNLA
ncbi:MAG: IS1182 family transposase [bacterium]